MEVFGDHGLANARLEDIAKRAGVSKGTIYLYFPNKEALFEENDPADGHRPARGTGAGSRQ